MTTDAIYQIGKFEFNTQSWALRRPEGAEVPPLHESEARLLIFLIENHGKANSSEEYKQRIIDSVWTNRGKHVEPGSLRKLVGSLRSAFAPYEDEYILNRPYRLHLEPKLLRELEPGPSLDRCECCAQGLGVIADLRFGRSLVSSGLRNPTWAENTFRRWNADLSRQEHNRSVLSTYFFPLTNHDRDSKQRVALMAGIDYPASPPKFSEFGSLVASHYVDAFGTGSIERVEDLERLTDDDALVLLGSHEVNPKIRQYMGDPKKHSPTHHIKGKAAKAIGYEAELPWAIFTPEDAPERHILQTRENKPFLHTTRDHIISSLEGSLLRSVSGKDGDRDVWLTDYLLITSLPTDAIGKRRVISFIGLHLTGTLAAGKLLREAPPAILETIHRTLGAYPYFQALIPLEVDNSLSGQGSAQPGRWGDVEVAPISIRKLRNTR